MTLMIDRTGREYMIYCCEDCGFLFRRMGTVKACPFCENPRFRPATAEEEKRLQALLQQEKGIRKGDTA